MTNQYMNNLYRDLLSNSPQTVTIDIPTDMGTGQISQIVTKQGAVVSDWKMNYYSDMNVQGVNSEEYIQLLFCFNDGVSWNIEGSRQSASIQKGESCIYRGHGKMEYLCYSGKSDFLFKNIKIPLSYFYKILNDYFEDSEIDAYEKKLLTVISKINITPYMEHIFAELKDFTQYRGGVGYMFLESKIFELLSVYLSEVLELSILASNYISISKSDRDAIIEAKRIIDSHCLPYELPAKCVRCSYGEKRYRTGIHRWHDSHYIRFYARCYHRCRTAGWTDRRIYRAKSVKEAFYQGWACFGKITVCSPERFDRRMILSLNCLKSENGVAYCDPVRFGRLVWKKT